MPLWNCTEWGEEEEEEVEYAIHLALLKYHEVGEYVVILAFALISGLAKLAFHHAHFVSSRVPESWSVLKHRKNCECCPGHYLIVNHYSSI